MTKTFGYCCPKMEITKYLILEGRLGDYGRFPLESSEERYIPATQTWRWDLRLIRTQHNETKIKEKSWEKWSTPLTHHYKIIYLWLLSTDALTKQKSAVVYQYPLYCTCKQDWEEVLGTTTLSNGKTHFGSTSRTGQSAPLKMVPNIPVGLNRNGPFHLNSW